MEGKAGAMDKHGHSVSDEEYYQAVKNSETERASSVVGKGAAVSKIIHKDAGMIARNAEFKELSSALSTDAKVKALGGVDAAASVDRAIAMIQANKEFGTVKGTMEAAANANKSIGELVRDNASFTASQNEILTAQQLAMANDTQAMQNFVDAILDKAQDRSKVLSQLQKVGLTDANGKVIAKGDAAAMALARLKAGDMAENRQLVIGGERFNVDRDIDGNVLVNNSTQENTARGWGYDLALKGMAGEVIGTALEVGGAIATVNAVSKKLSKDGKGIIEKVHDKWKSIISGKPVSNSVNNAPHGTNNHGTHNTYANPEEKAAHFNSPYSNIQFDDRATSIVQQYMSKSNNTFDAQRASYDLGKRSDNAIVRGVAKEIAQGNSSFREAQKELLQEKSLYAQALKEKGYLDPETGQIYHKSDLGSLDDTVKNRLVKPSKAAEVVSELDDAISQLRPYTQAEYLGSSTKVSGLSRVAPAIEEGAEAAAKGGFKTFMKKIPLISLFASLAFAGQRAYDGDYSGAGLEVLSGLAGTVPGIGTAASLGIDGYLMAKDSGLIGSAYNSATGMSISAATALQQPADLDASITTQTTIMQAKQNIAHNEMFLNQLTNPVAPARGITVETLGGRVTFGQTAGGNLQIGHVATKIPFSEFRQYMADPHNKREFLERLSFARLDDEGVSELLAPIARKI